MSGASGWNAEKYAGISQQQMQWALQTLGYASVKGDESILDIGCGDGKITAALANLTTGSVTGIDRSREMISYATRHYQTSEHANLSFCVGRAEAFFPEKRVDVITSFTALHWVSDHNRLLQHFASILSERGTLVLQFPGSGNAADLIECAFQIMHSLPWEPHFRSFSFPWQFFAPGEYETLLIGAGFQPRALELLPRRMTHEGAEGLTDWMEATWLPFTECVPPKQRQAFLSEIVDLYLSHHPEDERGVVTTQMYRLHVIATRSKT